ncbi:MAG TPA: prolyl oligopeptidase family serine peptidase [Pseudonocardiaceae bacterium]|nr:prolyl oligopeptidase family serine peptidase [Pseudonocardiaceae bacterium]
MNPASSDEAGGFMRHRRARLAAELPGLGWLAAETCTSPALSPDGNTLAVVSDRDGTPRVWLIPLAQPGPPVRLDTGEDYVRMVSWSPDGEWLCLTAAPGGGERFLVRALRPDGCEARVVAGTPAGVASISCWQPGGHIVGLAQSSASHPAMLDAYAVDICSGRRRYLASGPAATVCTFSHDGRYAVVRLGARGMRRLLLVDTRTAQRVELLGADATIADARFAPDSRMIYLHTDASREFAALLALPRVAAGHPEAAKLIAARKAVELERFALDPTGRSLVAVWNVDGHSELELIGLTGKRKRCALPQPPGEVVTGCAFAQDGGSLVLAVESGAEPPHVLRYPLPPTEPVRLAPVLPPSWSPEVPTRPELHRWQARDGLQLSGWLYRPAGALGASPTLVWLHGGPEAQQRPTFDPLYQVLLSYGVAVFAPNVRGSSGFGRAFVDADVHHRRFAAVADVADVVGYLVDTGLGDPSALACAGRSYGGYLTIATMVSYPTLFRAGVDICGITDFETFFAHTEPWIAAAAVSRYGDPRRDAALLRELSPIHRLGQLRAPVLVVHGAQDTNVPTIQAEQLIAALRARGASPDYLVLPDEGHEFLGATSRAVYLQEVVHWLLRHLLGLDERSA